MWGAIIGAVGRAVGGAGARTAATRAAASSRGAATASRAARRSPTPKNVRGAQQARAGAMRDQAVSEHASHAADRNDRAMDWMQGVVGEVEKGQNYFAHAITVTVKGGPKASLRRCWFLCVAAMFGRRQRGIESVWGESINAQWDITGKTVTATLAYTTGSMNDPWQNFYDTQHPAAMLQRGPDQVTIGAGWAGTVLTVEQQKLNFFGLNQGLNNARMVGGQLVMAPTTSLAPLPGELADPTKGNKLAVPPSQVYPLTAGMLYDTSVNPGAGVSGWRIVKADVDALQPRPIAIVQPFTIVQTNHALSEMPVRVPGSGIEAMPYQAHKPEAAGEGWKYVFRGGSIGYIPALPDDGRVITTGEKFDIRVQPPRPPVDGVSRGSLLVMVAAALSSPGELVPAPPNYPANTETLAAEGLFMWRPNIQYNIFGLATSDRYRYQPTTVASQVQQLFNAFRLDMEGHYTPSKATNVRPVGN